MATKEQIDKIASNLNYSSLEAYEKSIEPAKAIAKTTQSSSATKTANAETTKTKTPTKTALDMQKKKEDALDEKNPVDSEQIKKERIKKEYAEVKEKLDEEKKNVMKEQAKGRLAQNEAIVMADLTAEQRRLATRELQLRAANDAILQEEREAADAAVTAQNLQTLSQFSEAEKKKLDEYINKKLYLKSGGYVKAEMPEELVRKYGAERASELAETYWREKNVETAKKYEEAGATHADKHPLLSNVATVPINIVAGITGAAGHAADAELRTGQYQTLDPNAAGTEYQKYSNAIRGETVKNIEGEDPNGWRKAASIAYQGGMALADSTAQAATLGGAGAALLAGSNTFSQTLSDASAVGATPEQAVAMATSAAAIEALSEKIPMDNLADAFKGSKKSGMELLKQVTINAGIEMTTEELSFAGTFFAELAILKEKSSYKQDITNGILQGLSPAEAVAQANKNVEQEALNIALVSGISGGGGHIVANAFARGGDNRGTVTEAKTGEVAKTREDLAKRYGQQEQDTETFNSEQDRETAPKSILTALENQQKDDQWSDKVAPFRAADMEAIKADPETMQWIAERGMDGELNEVLSNVQSGKHQIVKPQTDTQPVQKTDGELVQDTVANLVRQKQAAETQTEQAPVEIQKETRQEKSTTKLHASEQPQQQQHISVQENLNQTQIERKKAENTYPTQETEKTNGKPIKDFYYHPIEVAPSTSFFGDQPMQGGKNIQFRLHDDNSVELKLEPFSGGKLFTPASLYRDFGALYDFVIDGKRISEDEALSNNGYYTFSDEVRPVVRKINNGNFIPAQKGELHLYSDLRDPIDARNQKRELSEMATAEIQTKQAPPEEQEARQATPAESQYETQTETAQQQAPENQPTAPSQQPVTQEAPKQAAPPIQQEQTAQPSVTSIIADAVRKAQDGGNASNNEGNRVAQEPKVQPQQKTAPQQEQKPAGVADIVADMVQKTNETGNRDTTQDGLQKDAKTNEIEQRRNAAKEKLAKSKEDLEMLKQTAKVSASETAMAEEISAAEERVQEARDDLFDIEVELAEHVYEQKQATGKYLSQAQASSLINIKTNILNMAQKAGISPDKINEFYRKTQEINAFDMTKKDAKTVAEAIEPIASEIGGDIVNSYVDALKKMAGNDVNIKGTGAAEQNFTGTAAYDDLLSDDNVQPPRRNDAREIEVPKTDAEGKNVSRFMSNAMNASVTTDEFTDTIKKMVMKGEGSYDVVSDESMLQQAAAEIKTDGSMTESVNKLRETAQSGKVGNTDIAKGELLYAQLVNDKSQVSQEMAADVLVSLKEMATTSGRNLHLFSLLQKLTPEGRLMTVKKTVDRYVESINEGRSGRQKVELDQRGKEGKKPASNSVKEARKTAGNDATKAANSVRYKNNKVTVEGNQSGEPFVFEYAQKVGEALAQGLARKPKPKAEKTFLQTITGELRKFAQEKMPQSQKGRSMTATELLKDYVQNQDFYNQAWESAQYELQQKHGNDPRLQEFLGSGIGVDANVNPRNKIFSRALASAAMESGETVSMLRKQQALGITNMSENITQKLIDETGATGEIAQTIRDAAKEYVNSVTRAEDSKNNAKTYTSGQFVDEAMRDIRKSMSDVAKMNKGGRDAVKQEVVRTLVDKYGFGQADASHVADVVSNTFNVKAQDQARKILEQKFGEREKVKPKSAGQLAEEYANLGAFDQESQYSDQATESIIRAAMHDIGKTVSDLAKSGKTGRATAMDQISQMITERHGLDKADADHVASVVSEQLTAMVEGRAKKILEQKFATRPERVQKTAEQMLAEYAKLGAFDPLSEYNEKATAKIVGEQYNAKINSDLADAFVNATTQAEQEVALDAIYKDVAAQIKPTLGEQWDAWRNLAMMGNAKTHERNMGSTAAFQPFVDVKRTIAATIESAFVNKENRTKAVLGISKNDNALVQWAKGDAKSQTATEAMQQGGTGRDTAKTKIQEYRKILPGVLDTVSKKNMQLMEKEDMLFKRREYSLTLASFLKSKGYTAEQVTKGQVPGSVLAEGRQIAIQEAMKATFTDRNRFSDAAARLHVKGKDGWSKALNAVAKGAVPFTRTPANVVVRVKEYSPFEIARGFHTLATKVQTGEATIAEGIEQIASGMTGSLMYAAGAALKAGIIPGVELIGRIEDEDEYPEEAQEYSVRIGDKYYGVGWLAPAAIPLFIGANLYGSWSKKEANGEVNDAWDAVDAIMNIPADIIDPMLELSMLSSLKDLSDTFSNAETAGRGMLDAITTAAANYFTQGLPTILGQAEQATETTKTTTFINTDNPTEKTVKGIISNAAQRIPGVDAYRTQKLDQWGRPVEAEGDLIDRAKNAFLNPFTVTQAKEDPLMDEIKRLNKAQEENVSPSYIPKTISYTDKDGNLHKDYRLTEEEYQKMAEVQGQTAREILDKMIESPSYKGMDDGMKAKAMQMAYSYAREKAKGEVLGTTYSDSWMMGMIKGTEANKIIMKVSQNELNSALSNIKTARANNYSKENQTKYVQDLEKAYTAYSKMDSSKKLVVMESATGDTKKYLEVRQKGVTTQQYLDATKAISNLKPETDYAEVRDIQIREAIGDLPGMSDTAKDTLMKAYMTDYDPSAKSPQTTELKYDYARQELGLSPSEYSDVYRVQLDGGKKAEKIAEWRSMGYTKEEANMFYRLFAATGKTKIDVVKWYNE